MKVKVIKAFNDKANNFTGRPVNEVYECSNDRAAELISKGFVLAVEENKTKSKN